jgi:hypothetical protein
MMNSKSGDRQGFIPDQLRKLAMRHRLHIGTIVSDTMMKVKFISGGFIGVIEEYFISDWYRAMFLHWQEETWNL